MFGERLSMQYICRISKNFGSLASGFMNLGSKCVIDQSTKHTKHHHNLV